MEIVEAIGKEMVPGDPLNPLKPAFKIDDHNEQAIRLLIWWHYSDPAFENESPNFSLNKGILLRGNVGTGKTVLMEIFAFMAGRQFNWPVRYQITDCREVARIFSNEGPKTIERFGAKSFHSESTPHGSRLDYSRPTHKCFDDLGTEDNASKFYGNQANVMAEVLLDRYRMFTRYGMLTLLTTNLAPSEMKDMYGDRVVSRLREMVNDIVIGGKDRRK